MLKLKLFLPAILAMPLLGGLAGAQEQAAGTPQVQRFNAGYSQNIRPGEWFPVQVVVSNPGAARDVDLVLSASASLGGVEPFLVRSPLHLPADSTRLATVYMLADIGADLSLEIQQAGNRLARARRDPSYLSPRDLLVLGLSSADQSFSCPQPPENPGAAAIRTIFNNSLSFNDLPARRQGFGAVDGIILGPLPAEGVPAAKEAAIVDWVRAGGLLILCPGGSPAHYAGTLIDDVSPVEVVGERWVQELPALEALYGPMSGPQKRIGLSEVVVRAGDVRLRMGDFPLIVSRPEGSGRVVFLAFDAANERLTGWAPMRLFYRDLLEARGTLPADGRTQAPQAAAALLNERVGVRVLPRWSLGLCLAANLGVVAAILIFGRRRREWAYAALVVAAPLAAFAIHAAGRISSGGDVSMSGIQTFRSGPGDRHAAGTGYYAFFSPVEASCDISLPGEPPAFLRGLESRAPETLRRNAAVEAARESVEMADGDAKMLSRLHVRPRTVTAFQADFDADLPGWMDASTTAVEDGLRIDVTNRSPMTVSNIVLLCNRNAVVIGDLAPGASGAATLTRSSARGMLSGFTRKAIRSRQEVECDRIIQGLFSAPRAEDIFDTGALMLGWVEGWPVPARFAGLDPEPKAAARTLWAVNAARRRPESGRILLPRGTVPLRVEGDTSEILVNGAWKTFSRKTVLMPEFAVPAAYRPLKAGRAEFFLETGLAPAAGTVEAWNCVTRRYDLLWGASQDGVVSPSPLEKTEFVIPEPEKYLEASTGRIRFRVTLQPAQSGGAALAARAIVVETLDLEIEGNVE